jgi:tetratricopeptide (TPR) repeat protein
MREWQVVRTAIMVICAATLLIGISCAPTASYRNSRGAVERHLSKSEIKRYMAMGIELSTQEKFKAAAEVFQKIIDDDTMNVEALIRHGYACTQNEEYADARYDFTRVIDHKIGDTAEAFLLRGTVYANTAQYAYAVKDFDVYLNVGGKNIDSASCLFRRAKCYYDENKFDSALADCKSSLGRFEYEEYVREMLGDIYCRLGKNEQAGEEYQKAQALYQEKNRAAHFERIKGKVESRCNRPDAIPSLQLKIDKAKPGDLIEIPAGTYNDHLFIYDKEDLRLIAVGGVAKLRTDNAHQQLIMIKNSRNITIDGFLLRHDVEGSAVCNIEIDSSEGVSVRNCEIVGSDMNGVYVKASKEVAFDKCVIHHCDPGLSFWNVDGAAVTQCRFWNNGFHYTSHDVTYNDATTISFDKNNTGFPDKSPLQEGWLSLLNKEGRLPLFNDKPYLLSGDFNGDGHDEYALQTQRANFSPDTGLDIAIISGTSHVDVVRLPVNQNFSWSVRNGRSEDGPNPSPDSIACEFNAAASISEGIITTSENGGFFFQQKR